jgi:mannose-6-phosphate isomerase-like protein (cupin superfamily)
MAEEETVAAHFDDLEPNEQDSGDHISYQFVVKPGTLGLMSAGRVRLRGPTTKQLDTHEGWDQVYLIQAGSGRVIVGNEEIRAGPRMAVRIPRHTLHGVVLDEGETLEYIYVNAFVDEAALEKLKREAGIL